MNPIQTSLGTSLNLIDQAQRSDPDAWRRLCSIYSPLVYGWARKAGLQESDAGDIVQEVFRIVSTHLAKFRHDRPDDTFRGWLLTITRNEIRGWFRRQSRQAAAGEGGSTAMDRIQQAPDWIASDTGLDSLDEDGSDERDLMRRAAEIVRQDFEPHTWQAFWRSVVEGHAAAEIAADLHMTTGAVRQAKFRVLARLRETIGDL